MAIHHGNKVCCYFLCSRFSYLSVPRMDTALHITRAGGESAQSRGGKTEAQAAATSEYGNTGREYAAVHALGVA